MILKKMARYLLIANLQQFYKFFKLSFGMLAAHERHVLIPRTLEMVAVVPQHFWWAF